MRCVLSFFGLACHAEALEHCLVNVKLPLDQISNVFPAGCGEIAVLVANAYAID